MFNVTLVTSLPKTFQQDLSHSFQLGGKNICESQV